MTNKYETIFIVNTGLGEEGIKELVSKFSALIAENGTVESVEDWGKRVLAYEINDLKDGYYTLINFEAPPEFPAELDRIFKITEGVIRSIIVRKGE